MNFIVNMKEIEVGDKIVILPRDKIAENESMYNFLALNNNTLNILLEDGEHTIIRKLRHTIREGLVVCAVDVKSRDGRIECLFYPFECKKANELVVELL